METAQTTQTVESARSTSCTCTARPFMTVAEAARLIRSSKEYLYAGLRQRRYPGAQFGRSWRIHRAFVEGFVEMAKLGQVTNFDEYAATWVSRASSEVAV
ncbi:excisionase family DNA-binding protein [Nonomuraea sp. NPDC049646]|uniref:excisionase family DNA-binding protein n=1 Tax=unclassified Nonomuraea TaxID=2593643 RepID=UPI0037BA8C42